MTLVLIFEIGNARYLLVRVDGTDGGPDPRKDCKGTSCDLDWNDGSRRNRERKLDNYFVT